MRQARTSAGGMHRRGGRVAPILVLGLAALAAAWLGLWLLARQAAESNLAAWIDAEHRQGRLWTCPARRIGGFPLAIVVDCSSPSFSEAGNMSFKGELHGLRAEAQLYRPDSVEITLAGPLTLVGDAAASGLTVDWASATLTLQGLGPGTFESARMEGRGIALTGAGLSAPVRIARGGIAARPLPRTAAGLPDVELTIGLADMTAADVDPAFGSGDPINATLVATARRVPDKGGSLPTLLEAWRTAGGRLDFARFDFTKGGFRAGGQGQVRIDEAHRLAGELEAQFSGLEPIAARYGIPLGAVKVGGLLAGLLGGRSSTATAAQTELSLPLAARAGRLFVGPVKTGVVLPPLY